MSLILSGVVNICQLVGNIPICLYLDRLGRRNLAVIGAFAMAVPHLIMAGLTGEYSSNWGSHRGVGWFSVALICMALSLSTTMTQASNIRVEIPTSSSTHPPTAR